MAQRGVFVRAEEVAFLDDAAKRRRQYMDVRTRAKPQGELYKAVERVVDAIDGLSEAATGDRPRFYRRDATTPDSDLPPTRFRTVE
jgi:hypothetical protein